MESGEKEPAAIYTEAERYAISKRYHDDRGTSRRWVHEKCTRDRQSAYCKAWETGGQDYTDILNVELDLMGLTQVYLLTKGNPFKHPYEKPI